MIVGAHETHLLHIGRMREIIELGEEGWGEIDDFGVLRYEIRYPIL